MADLAAETQTATQLEGVATNTPPPLNEDGSVNQAAFWSSDPAGWAKWNDAQRQDGGTHSQAFIAKNLAAAETELQVMQEQYNAEMNPDNMAAMETAIQEKAARVTELQNLMQTYAPRVETKADVQTSKVVQAQNAEPAQMQQEIPTDKKGNKLYHLAPQQQTLSELLNDFSVDEVRGFAEANVADAQKQKSKTKAPDPKQFTSPADYAKKKKEYESKMADLTAREQYWTDVLSRIKEELGREVYNPLLQPQEEYRPSAVVKSSYLEPQTPLQAAAWALGTGRIKLLYSSVKYHTGYRAELKKYRGIFARAENGGVSVEEAGERLLEMQHEDAFAGEVFDENDPTQGMDAILSAIKAYPTKGAMLRGVRSELQDETSPYNDASFAIGEIEYQTGTTIEELAEQERKATIARLRGNETPIDSLEEDVFLAEMVNGDALKEEQLTAIVR